MSSDQLKSDNTDSKSYASDVEPLSSNSEESLTNTQNKDQEQAEEVKNDTNTPDTKQKGRVRKLEIQAKYQGLLSKSFVVEGPPSPVPSKADPNRAKSADSKNSPRSRFTSPPQNDKPKAGTAGMAGEKQSPERRTPLYAQRTRPINRPSPKSGSGIPLSVSKSGTKKPSRNNIAASSNKDNYNAKASPPPTRYDPGKKSLENTYNFKLKRLNTMKKDLLDRQKPVMELYKALMDMKSKIYDTEGKDVPLEEIKLIEIQPNSPKLLAGEAKEYQRLFTNIKEKLLNIPTTCMGICQDILKTRYNILDGIFNEEGEYDQDALLEKIKHFKQETKKSEAEAVSKIREEETLTNTVINECLLVLKHAGPINVEELQQKQELELRVQELEHKLKHSVADLQFERNKKLKENEKLKECERDIIKLREKIQELSKSLEDEKAKCASHKERSNTVESKLKTAKNKMKEAEQARFEAETKVQELTQTYRKQEEQWRSKEITYENKIRELQKICKSTESLVTKLEKEKQSVDIRLSEQDERCKGIEDNCMRQVTTLEQKLKQSEAIEAQLRTSKAKADTELEFLRAKILEIQHYNTEFFDLCRKKDEYMESGEPKTEKEVQLWTELEATKAALKAMELKIDLYSDEKSRFIETIRKTYENFNSESTMTLHILEKERVITNLIFSKIALEDKLNKKIEQVDQMKVVMEKLEKRLLTVEEEMTAENKMMVDKYHKELESAVHCNKQLEDKVAVLELDLGEAKRSLASMRSGPKFDKNLQTEEVVARIDRQTSYSKLLEMHSQSAEELKRAKEENNNLRHLISQQDLHFNNLERRFKELDERFATTMSKKEEMKKQVSHLQRSCIQLRSELLRLRSEQASFNCDGARPSSRTRRLQLGKGPRPVMRVRPPFSLALSQSTIPSDVQEANSAQSIRGSYGSNVSEACDALALTPLALSITRSLPDHSSVSPRTTSGYRRQFIDHVRTISNHSIRTRSYTGQSPRTSKDSPYYYLSPRRDEFSNLLVTRSIVNNFLIEIQSDLNKTLSRIAYNTQSEYAYDR